MLFLCTAEEREEKPHLSRYRFASENEGNRKGLQFTSHGCITLQMTGQCVCSAAQITEVFVPTLVTVRFIEINYAKELCKSTNILHHLFMALFISDSETGFWPAVNK